MNNKSKPNKMKTKKPVKKVKMPGEWFLMLRKETGIEEIKAVLPEDADIEIWKEAGVITVMLDEENAMDIEQLEADLGDEFSNQYMKNHGVICLYAISFKAEKYDLAKKYLDKLAGALDGFVCPDTDDFT